MEEEKYDDAAANAADAAEQERRQRLFDAARRADIRTYELLVYHQPAGQDASFQNATATVNVADPRRIAAALTEINNLARRNIDGMESSVPNQANFIRSNRTLQRMRDNLVQILRGTNPNAMIPAFPQYDIEDLDTTDREYGKQIQNALGYQRFQTGSGINPWIAHVKKVQKQKGISYKEAMKIAKQSYK